jgi:hypothetical protein
MLLLKCSADGVKHSGLLFFFTLSIVRYSKKLENTAFHKMDLFPSSGEGKTPTLLGLLERANLKISSFQNIVFSIFLEYRTVDKVQKPGISELKTCFETMFSMRSVSRLYTEILWASACETKFSAPLVNFQVAHRSAVCTWLSKFRIFMIT